MTTPLRRVLMTTDAVGGVFSYALDLAGWLSRRGVELILASMGPAPSASQRAQASSIAGLTLVDSAYQLEWMDEPWRDVAAAGDWLLALERRYQPDLVHLNGYAHGALPFRAPTLVVAHSCVLSWWQAVHGEPAPARYDVYRERVRSGLCGADLIVAPSRAMLSALHHHYGPLPLGRVIHNGCDLRAFEPAAKDAQIVAAGRMWDQAKNLEALERAAPQLPWPVRIAGQTQAPGGQPASARARSSAELLGSLSRGELAQLLARAAIYAAPARYEPFGLSVLEAAAAGCALVLGDIPSLRELWADCALFVPPEDECALASVLRQLVDDASLRERLARAASLRARLYSLERCGESYLEAYQALSSRSYTSTPPPAHVSSSSSL